MALSNIITEIVGLLNAVADMGKVTDYLRWTPDEASRNEAYVKNGILNAWIVTRESTAARDVGAGANNVRDRHTIVIHGYRAVTSAADSEKLHQDLAEGVRSKLHLNRKLPNNAGWLSTPVQIRAFNAGMFLSAVLCWHCELTVVAEERLQGG